jgi:hypothetical protein
LPFLSTVSAMELPFEPGPPDQDPQQSRITALLLPLGQETVLVLGSDKARNFTPRDIAWCQVVVARLAEQA